MNKFNLIFEDKFRSILNGSDNVLECKSLFWNAGKNSFYDISNSVSYPHISQDVLEELLETLNVENIKNDLWIPTKYESDVLKELKSYADDEEYLSSAPVYFEILYNGNNVLKKIISIENLKIVRKIIKEILDKR
jgi:hypothetical protein